MANWAIQVLLQEAVLTPLLQREAASIAPIHCRLPRVQGAPLKGKELLCTLCTIPLFNHFLSLALAQEKSGDKSGHKAALQKPTHFVCFQGSGFAL